MPVIGPLDVTTTEISEAALNALRLAALGLAFAAYALLLDHDRLVAAAGRRSALGARRRARDPARAVARARRRRSRRVGARPRRPARGRARLRDAALAARRRLARAGDEPRRGDGCLPEGNTLPAGDFGRISIRQTANHKCAKRPAQRQCRSPHDCHAQSQFVRIRRLPRPWIVSRENFTAQVWSKSQKCQR